MQSPAMFQPSCLCVNHMCLQSLKHLICYVLSTFACNVLSTSSAMCLPPPIFAVFEYIRLLCLKHIVWCGLNTFFVMF